MSELPKLSADELSGGETAVDVLDEECTEEADKELEELLKVDCAPPTSIIFIS